MSHGEDLSGAYWYDQIGDGYNLICVDEATDTVQNYYATDDYKEMAARSQDWYEKGLIYKDAATTQDYADTLVKAGSGFAEIRAIEIGSLEASQAQTGYELIQKDIVASKLGTSLTQKFGYCVPVTSSEPEAAVRFLNYLFQSPELCNILTWGIEGVNWVTNADGQATYPEGVTADNVGYHTSDFLYGNQMLITPWEGSALDIREQQQTEMDNAERSKYMGFSVDNTGLENIIAACHDVCNHYHPTLDSGSSGDWEATLAEFNSKLEAAGMNELLAAYQEQLDAWLLLNA
jgi:putative aldouronate transport system substrate-binding protein